MNIKEYLNFQSKHAFIQKWNYSCMKTLIPIRFWSCNIVLHLLGNLLNVLKHNEQSNISTNASERRIREYAQLEEWGSRFHGLSREHDSISAKDLTMRKAHNVHQVTELAEDTFP